MTLTRPQREALRRVYLRTVEDTCFPLSPSLYGYRALRRTVVPGPGCIMVPFAGMWLGIEPDGYTHS